MARSNRMTVLVELHRDVIIKIDDFAASIGVDRHEAVKIILRDFDFPRETEPQKSMDNSWVKFVLAWNGKHGDKPVKVYDLFTLASYLGSGKGEGLLRDEIVAESEDGRRKIFGRLLAGKRLINIGGYKIVPLGITSGYRRYRLAKT